MYGDEIRFCLKIILMKPYRSRGNRRLIRAAHIRDTQGNSIDLNEQRVWARIIESFELVYQTCRISGRDLLEKIMRFLGNGIFILKALCWN